MREDADDRAVWVLHEEPADAPRLVGLRVDHLQSPLHDLGVSRVDGLGVTDVDAKVRLRLLDAGAATTICALGFAGDASPRKSPPSWVLDCDREPDTPT